MPDQPAGWVHLKAKRATRDIADQAQTNVTMDECNPDLEGPRMREFERRGLGAGRPVAFLPGAR